MIKKIVLMIVVSVLTGLGTMLPASDHSGLEFGLSLNYGVFEESDYESGYGVAALINYNLGKSFTLQLQGGYQVASTFNDPEGLDQGQLSLIPIQFSLFYRIPVGKKMAVRLGGGVGYAFTSFKLDNEGTWNDLAFTTTQNLDPGLLYHAALAFDFQVSEKIVFFVEGRYCMGQLDGEYEMIDQIGGESVNGGWQEDVKYIAVTAGISVSLKKTPSVQRFVVPEREQR